MEFCVKLLSLPLWERGLKFSLYRLYFGNILSLPLWERGLKCPYSYRRKKPKSVAPLVGAWIEIWTNGNVWRRKWSRSPCGSVD